MPVVYQAWVFWTLFIVSFQTGMVSFYWQCSDPRSIFLVLSSCYFLFSFFGRSYLCCWVYWFLLSKQCLNDIMRVLHDEILIG